MASETAPVWPQNYTSPDKRKEGGIRHRRLAVFLTLLCLSVITNALLWLSRQGGLTNLMLLARRDKNTTDGNSSRPVFPEVSEAPFSVEDVEMRRIRNAASKLHPDRKFRLGKWPVSCLRKTGKTKSKKHCPPSKHKIGNYRRCAVVGNSGILLGSDCGADIDAKDYVIRIDLPPVAGFENDVGRKTNMTVLNMDTPKRLEISSRLKNRSLDMYEHRLRGIAGTVLLANRESQPYLKKAFQRYHVSFVLLTSASSFTSAEKINPIASKIARKRYMKKHPSTGMATVLIATTFCDRLFLYGFFPFGQDENKRPIPYHYYPDDGIRQKPIAKDKMHHMDTEYSFYKRLNQSSKGVLKLHIRECDNQ